MLTRFNIHQTRSAVRPIRKIMTQHQMNIESYARLVSRTIYDTIHPPTGYNIHHKLISITIKCDVKYKELLITHQHHSSDIEAMIKNLSLLELRELLVTFAGETLVVHSNNNNTFEINTIKKIKFAIDILTETIKMYEATKRNDPPTQLFTPEIPEISPHVIAATNNDELKQSTSRKLVSDEWWNSESPSPNTINKSDGTSNNTNHLFNEVDRSIMPKGSTIEINNVTSQYSNFEERYNNSYGSNWIRE